MPVVGIIDYGMGNIDSMRRALEECGARRVLVAREPEQLHGITHMVLPGVGSFNMASTHLKDAGFPDVIRQLIRDKEIPLLGVCLGMQLLATEGEEGGVSDGLDLIPGRIIPLEPSEHGERIPHVGWNEIKSISSSSRLLKGFSAGEDFYFVHSFQFATEEKSSIAAETPYCGTFTSVVEKGCVFGTQFHPEKSQRAGFKLLRNFLAL